MARTTILIAVALVSLPTVASAQRSAPISVTAPLNQAVVSYADLDLGSAAGKRLLDRRIASAIEDVCGSFANVREHYEEVRISQCRAEARQSADRQFAQRTTEPRLALKGER